MTALASRLGIAGERAWRSCDDFWPVLQKAMQAGAVIVIKLDGLRTGEDDPGPYSVVISGGALGDGFARRDADSISEALAETILEYAEVAWT
jgi:hypothetical protein